MHVLNVRCEFRVAKASINVPSPGAYPISDIRYPRLRLRTLTLSRSDAHERGLARQRCCASFVHGYDVERGLEETAPNAMFNPSKVAFARLQSGKTNFLDRESKDRGSYLKRCEWSFFFLFFLSRLDKVKYNFVNNL